MKENKQNLIILKLIKLFNETQILCSKHNSIKPCIFIQLSPKGVPSGITTFSYNIFIMGVDNNYSLLKEFNYIQDSYKYVLDLPFASLNSKEFFYNIVNSFAS